MNPCNELTTTSIARWTSTPNQEMMMNRPDSGDRKKLIRDLSQLSKILDQRVKTLETQLESCQKIVESLKRKLRGHNDDNA